MMQPVAKKNYWIEWITSGQFLYHKKLATLLWFGLSFFAVIRSIFPEVKINNFIIYRSVFWHILEQKNLYLHYPAEYADVNLYGPFFSIVIAPFALLPAQLGVIAWVLFNAAILYYAILKLPIVAKYKYAILILCSHEMMNAASWLQINPFIAACIILGFVYIHEGKEKWALLFILAATFIKLYGIVGFAFFFFSKNKFEFIKWTLLWAILFFALPFVWGHPNYILQCYPDWYEGLRLKAYRNIRLDIKNDYQDISVMGMIRRLFNWQSFNDGWVLLPAFILFAIQYVQYRYFKDVRYRLYLLCSVLICTVIFSTGSESPTYIIAFPAVCIWFLMQPKSKSVTLFFIFAMLLTSFSYSDIFTPYVRIHLIRPYSLKALPCTLLWLVILWQLFTQQFLKVEKNKLILENG